MKPSPEKKWLDFRLSDETAEIPFFIFLTLVLGGLGIGTVVMSPALHDPLALILFAVLMVIHIGLYWLAIRIMGGSRWVVIYLLIQGGLAFGLNLLGRNLALIFGLYLGLIGITTGMLGLTWRGGLMIAFYLALSLFSYGVCMGWDQIIGWPIAVTPMAIFVVIYVVLYNRQIIARNRAQALLVELETANRRLGEYAARVEELTLSNERERMARELHDTLSQGLAGLILQLEAVDAHLSNERTTRARTIVQQAMLQARATLADARRAIGDLRESQSPVALDAEQTIRREIERFTAATGILCAETIDLPAGLSPALGESLQRILAEALTNIARHARANHVIARLAPVEGGIELVVQDDGVGFDPTATVDQPDHYGLLGMRERARLAGGTLDIVSQAGRGTVLKVWLPV